MTPNNDPSGRIGWIDYAKTMAIYLVVLLHTHCSGELTVAINSFVMPTFFFLSGFLFSRERNPDYKRFAYKRFRQLVVPYVWINLVAYLAWVVALRHYGDDSGAALQWREPLVAIALGVPTGLVHDIPLWSLLCFFVVEMIYYPLAGSLRVPDRIIAICAYAVASVESLLAPDKGLALPFTLAPAAAALAFYALGHLARTHIGRLRSLTRPDILWLLLGFALFETGVRLNVPTAFFIGSLGQPLWFAFTAVGGILMVIQVSAYLSTLFGDGKFIRFTSRGTLLICGFHLLTFSAIKGVMWFGAGVTPEALTAGVGRGIIMATVAFALCLPVIWIVERWMRFLVSK